MSNINRCPCCGQDMGCDGIRGAIGSLVILDTIDDAVTFGTGMTLMMPTRGSGKSGMILEAMQDALREEYRVAHDIDIGLQALRGLHDTEDICNFMDDVRMIDAMPDPSCDWGPPPVPKYTGRKHERRGRRRGQNKRNWNL